MTEIIYIKDREILDSRGNPTIEAAVVLAVLWVRRRMAASHWESSIDPALLEVLLEPGGRGGFRRLAWIVSGALALATVGLAPETPTRWRRSPTTCGRSRTCLPP